MTRKEFLGEMIQEIFGIKTIEYSGIYEDEVSYYEGGSLLRDCTYSSKYKKHMKRIVNPLFSNRIRKIKISKNKRIQGDVEEYRKNAKCFIVYLIATEDCNEAIVMEKLRTLTLSDLKVIYNQIIIYEIFNVKSESEESGNDDFEESQKKISKKIDGYVSSKFPDYNKKREAFLKLVLEEARLESSSMEIFYKSGMLKNCIDINEYIGNRNIELIELCGNQVIDFKGNVVYKYIGECFFEYINDNMIKVTIIYNGEEKSAFTSLKNWVNQSIISNYIFNNQSRGCVCYFIYDQGKTFQFLQIGDD